MLFTDCTTEEEVRALIAEEFASFRRQFESLRSDYNMGFVTNAEMIRLHGVLNRLTPIFDFREEFKSLTDFVNDVVAKIGEDAVDLVIRDFSASTIINNLAHIEISSENLQYAKKLLEYIDMFDSAMDLKIDFVKKSSISLNDPVPDWINYQFRSRNACAELLLANIDIFKQIFPHISMMASMIDTDNDRGTNSIYYCVCNKIYCDVVDNEPQTELDALIKKMILM